MTLKSALLTGKAGLLQSLQRLTLDPTYVPARLPEGMVVGIWGEAVVRLPDGTVRELKVGEMVRKGYVILTSQNGIVQLEVDGDRLARVPPDRDGLDPTAAGLNGGGEDGSLAGSERATRVIEIVSPNGFDYSTISGDPYVPPGPNANAVAAASGLPGLGVNQLTVDEGAGHAVFTVQLTRASDTPTTLNLTLADGTAVGGGVDYGSAGPNNLEVSLDNGVTWVTATSVTIPAGTTSVLVRTPVTDDLIRESAETFTLTATVVSGDVNVTQPTGTATIVDNGDTLPSFVPINDVVVNEAAGTATFTVKLSEPSGQTVTVRYSTADGTATGGVDYTPVNGQLTFAPGETTKTITVPITNDTVFENAETFFVQLSDPVNAGLPSPTGKGTILDNGGGIGGTDDDTPHVARITSPTVSEGQPLDFTVTLTHPSTTPTVLDVLPKSGTATLGVDTEPPQVSFDGGNTFVPITGTTVTVPPGTDTVIIRIPTVNDGFKEPAETITLDVKVPADTTTTQGVGTINPNPDETVIGVSIAGPADVTETVGNAAYTVTLSDKSATAITVQVKTADGVAKAGSDYTAVNQTLTFAPGETTKTVLVPITNDTTFEGKEDYAIALSAPTGATVVPAAGSVTTTIADEINKDTGTNNDAPTLAVSSLNVPESAGFAVFNVTLGVASGVTTTVSLALADGTAQGGGVDYGKAGGGVGNLQVSTDGGATWADATTATFAPGKTGVLVRTPVVVDTLDDSGETFTLKATTLTPADGTANPSATGTATIYDKPGILIDDITVNEGTGTATFTVTLTTAASTPVTVQFASEDGTAHAGTDYAAVSGALTFAPGELTKTITVPITDDTVFEGPETFKINLSSPSDNALIVDGLGLGTIKDDGSGTVPPGVTPTDDRPHAVINDVIVNEGAGTATFTVTLAGTATTPVTIDYATADGTAKAGLDYTTAVGTLTFAPGETSKSITVPILNDAVYEGSETFTVNLSNPSSNAVISDPLGLGTIKDDGSGTVPPGVTPDDDRPLVTINDVLVNEASKSAVFTVTLSNPSDLPVTVKYSSVNGSAEAGFDYEAVLGTLTFAPGELTKTISVPLQNDTVYEGAETFQIVLTDPTNAKVTPAGAGVDPTKDGTGIGTIVDDGTGTLTPDTPPGTPLDNDKPAIAINDITVNEAAGTATFTVTLTNAAKMPVTVAYASADGTATAGQDYTAVSNTLTFAPGETSKTITVPILNDSVYEGAETFTINLSSPTNATIADGIGLGTIKDDGTGTVPPGVTPDNDTPRLTIDSPTVVENLAGGHAVFTLTLSNPSTTATTVGLALTDGTAKGAGVDYGSTGSNNLQISTDGGATWVDATTATFAPNTTTLLVRTPLNNDKAIEPSEAFTLTATTTAGTTRTPTSTGTGTIADDDVAPVALPDTGRGDEDTPITGSVLTNDTDANGDPLTVSGFSIGGTPYAPGTTATIPGVGTISIATTGAYTFTPEPNYDGAVPVITYTVTDGANPVNGTLTLTINPVNDAPIVTAGAVTPLSEEGLTGGLADTTGTIDSTNLVVNTGQIGLRDIEGSPMTVVWSAVTASYTQGGIPITWTGDGTQTLVGRADGGPVILTATINNIGAYTVTLSGPIDHPAAGEDALQLDFGVVVSDGALSSPGTVSVRIEDDSPAALVTQTSSVHLQDTNLLITLDTSGSMISEITTGALEGQTRLQAAKAAITSLMTSYSEFGTVMVRLVTFADTATPRGTEWLTVAQANAILNTITAAGGKTNYDDAIAAASAAFTSTGRQISGQNVAYFVSDGNPTAPPATSPSDIIGIDPTEEANWKAFLNTNNINSYAIGITADVGQSALNPVAWNGATHAEANATVVTDLNQLNSVLQNTVPIPSGDLSAGGTFRSGGQVGADKGNVQSVTVDGVTYTYLTSGAGSGSSDPITVSGGADHHTYVSATKTLVVTTSAGGKFYIDLDDGTYEYRVPASLATATQTEVLSYVIADKDGDTQHAQIVVNVGTSTSSVVNSENVPTATHVGNSSDDILVGSAGNDYMIGGDGNDNLSGLLGNDALFGGWGNDTLVGGDGNDTLTGGQGNDALTGGIGSDVFAWTFNDGGAHGTPSVDTITDFDTRLPSAGGDIIDLRDMLSGETTGTLENYLEFSFAGSGSAATTTIHVSSTGAFAGGTYSSASEDQTIVLSGVDLRASLGLGSTATDADIIGRLLTQGKLIVDA
ncbi:Calx-beta domain-containing protein [Sphaerotilus sp.]|uniref:Calx-beta domain-containing protein n=1 Tax=Sphaerotilus sp. TaxID=2093942 RepID=UPI00286E04CB|nr:Calx-beta domain-containing protein [Sphaerotilus sp.]